MTILTAIAAGVAIVIGLWNVRRIAILQDRLDELDRDLG